MLHKLGGLLVIIYCRPRARSELSSTRRIGLTQACYGPSLSILFLHILTMNTRREQNTDKVRRKIRESCNTCSSQKIRCGKQRPICSRCAARGIECNYSYSQRTGRRAAMRPLSTETISTAASRSRENGHPQKSISMSMTPSLTPPTTGIMMDGVDTFSFEDLENITTNGFHASDGQAQDADTNISSDPFWLAGDAAPTSCNSFGNGTRPVPTEEEIGSLDLSFTTNADWHPLQSTASEADPECSTTPTAAEPIQESATPPAGFVAGRHHRQDCMTLALHVVDSLHVPRDQCNSAASDPMAWMQAPTESSRDVDAVLLLNRDAIKTIDRILDCPCSADQSVALACYLATAKIIYWYATATGISVDGFEAEDNSNGNTSANTSTNAGQGLLGDETRSKTMQNRVVSRPILMGRYCLDADTQRSVLAKVILSELKEHIQPLMNRLPRYGISHSDIFKGSEQGPSRLASLSSIKVVSCALRSQLKRIMSAAGNIANNS